MINFDPFAALAKIREQRGGAANLANLAKQANPPKLKQENKTARAAKLAKVANLPELVSKPVAKTTPVKVAKPANLAKQAAQVKATTRQYHYKIVDCDNWLVMLCPNRADLNEVRDILIGRFGANRFVDVIEYKPKQGEL